MLSKNEIKYIRSLQDKKHRVENNCYLAEGHKWVMELLQWQPKQVLKILAIQAWAVDHEKMLNGIEVQIIAPFELEKISALQTPQSVLALVQLPKTDFLPFSNNRWNLVLDGIQDPGNLGSIIRIADWFGLQTLYCSTDCADAFNPKVVQATMGSLCRVQVCYGSLTHWLSTNTLPVYTTGMQGESVFAKQLTPGVLIIGSEGKGVRPETAAFTTQWLSIPRIGHAESLNAAVATGIILSQLTFRAPLKTPQTRLVN